LEKVAGLVLAAGASTRMGRPKQLLEVRGKNLIDHILVEALKSQLNLVVLVLGYRASEIKEGLKTDPHDPKLKIIENKNFRDGISTSIIAGLSHVEGIYDHVMIILADMPHITAGLINLLLRQYLDSRFPLGAIKIKDRRSHPVIFSSRLFHELKELRGDVGARALFLKHPDKVCLVEPEEDYDDMDLDTPEDFIEFMKFI